MKKSLFLGAIFIAVSFLGISSTFACSCIMNGSPEEASENYSNIFIGDVVEVSESNISEEGLGQVSQNKVRINVENSIKGQNGDVMVVQTSQSSASCGYNFEQGEKYIVYSDNRGEEDGELNVSLCSRTALVGNAQEDLEAFGIDGYEEQMQVTITNTGTDNQTDTGSEVDEEETNTGSLDEDNNQEDEESIIDEITDPSDTNQNIFYIISLLIVITLAIVVVTNKSKSKD